MPYPRALRLVALLVLLPLAACELPAEFLPNDEPVVSVYADGLTAPSGLALDAEGRLWVAEAGSGADDGRISVVTADGAVHPFLTGLPSAIVQGGPSGPWRPYLLPDGTLLVLVGETAPENPLTQTLLTVPTEGFTPGDEPMTADTTMIVVDLGAFVLDQPGVETSNPYALTAGPEGDLFIVDAGGNMVVRRDDATGELSVFAAFADVANPTPIGPPTVDVVPTGIAYADGRFLVSSLTGFPFAEGLANLYEVDLEGNVSIYRDGFTLLTGVDLERTSGDPLVLQYGTFDPSSGFAPDAGRILRVTADGTETVVDELNAASAFHVAGPGELYVSSIADGQILRVTYTD